MHFYTLSVINDIIINDKIYASNHTVVGMIILGEENYKNIMKGMGCHDCSFQLDVDKVKTWKVKLNKNEMQYESKLVKFELEKCECEFCDAIQNESDYESIDQINPNLN